MVREFFCANPRNLREKRKFYIIPLIALITAEMIHESFLRKSARTAGEIFFIVIVETDFTWNRQEKGKK
jgi:hypothetical protein